MLFQRVGVQLRLLFSDIRILACPFGFDDRQRRAVLSEQDIIDISLLTGDARHVIDFDFLPDKVVEIPIHQL